MNKPLPIALKSYVTLSLSFLLWIFGGIVIAAILSQWESFSHGDVPDFAISRMTINLVFGGVVGLLARFVRFAKGG